MYESIRVVQDCKTILKRCLFSRPSRIPQGELRRLSTNIIGLANEGTGLNARGGGDGITVAEGEGSKALPEPNRWRAGRERGGRRMGLREKLCFSFFFFFDWCKAFQSGRTLLLERGRFFFLSGISVSFSLFLRCWYAVLCFLFRRYSISNEGNKYPALGMYVRTACGVRVIFLDGAWSSWHLQIACLHLIVWTVCSVTRYILLPRERASRTEPHATRSACTYPVSYLVPGIIK